KRQRNRSRDGRPRNFVSTNQSPAKNVARSNKSCRFVSIAFRPSLFSRHPNTEYGGVTARLWLSSHG
ncbi:unnamed protein product, partial [Musa textilis]